MSRNHRYTPIVVAIAGLLAVSGCTTAQTNQSASSSTAQAESVQPTGSRISRSVKKGSAAGVSRDMPGATAGAAMIQAAQNSNAQSDKSNAGGN